MSYRLLLHKNVSKFLKKCPGKQKQALKEKLDQLKQNPLNNTLDIKALQGYNNLYRLRVGQVRLIYQIENDELIIFIIKAGNRGDIYKDN
ncbi:MAG: type II toxin-antitoxin system RelE/ParE family toxin [Methylococcaceae bacterium]|nr:type II toxin-antitoxin system RelE/ParE family toxin [Methylococcaceae bacterium]